MTDYQGSGGEWRPDPSLSWPDALSSDPDFATSSLGMPSLDTSALFSSDALSVDALALTSTDFNLYRDLPDVDLPHDYLPPGAAPISRQTAASRARKGGQAGGRGQAGGQGQSGGVGQAGGPGQAHPASANWAPPPEWGQPNIPVFKAPTGSAVGGSSPTVWAPDAGYRGGQGGSSPQYPPRHGRPIEPSQALSCVTLIGVAVAVFVIVIAIAVFLQGNPLGSPGTSTTHEARSVVTVVPLAPDWVS